MRASSFIHASRYSPDGCSVALVEGLVSEQAARNSVKAVTARQRRMIAEVSMGDSLLDPILPVTKRDDATQLGKRSTALLAEVIKVRLRCFERPLAGNAGIYNTVAAQEALNILCE